MSDIVQVNFRMPAGLKEQLEAAAVANHRTLTAEIVARLEMSLVGPLQQGQVSVPAALLPLLTQLAEAYNREDQDFARTYLRKIVKPDSTPSGS